MGTTERTMMSILIIFAWYDHRQPTLHYDTDTPAGCPLLMPAENRQRRHILNKPLGLNIPHVNGVIPRDFPSHDVGLSTAFERQGMVSKRKAEIVTVGFDELVDAVAALIGLVAYPGIR